MHAHLWWKMHGASTPMLRKLAMRVLAQPASSSGCERFNSAGSHIMSVKQASMLTQNMETHLYVYHNLRVLDNIEQYDYVEQYYEWDESDSSDDEEVQVVEAPKGKGKEKSTTQ
ncbi:dimer_Tnp_hAT domain-containing protein [Pycnococcus provasolii]